MYEIILSPESKEDLNNIKSFIAYDNLIIAEKVINKIFNTLSNISAFPLIWK